MHKQICSIYICQTEINCKNLHWKQLREINKKSKKVKNLIDLLQEFFLYKWSKWLYNDYSFVLKVIRNEENNGTKAFYHFNGPSVAVVALNEVIWK